MTPQSQIAVSLYKQHRIVSPLLSNQYRIDYPLGAWLERSDYPCQIISSVEAEDKYPQIKAEIERLVSLPTKLPDCEAKAFVMDTEFLGKQVRESINRGVVFILPDCFGDSIKEILNQKPSSVFHRAIDYRGYAHSHCWKVERGGELGTYDLWVDAFIHGGYDLDEAFSFVYCWTDVIVICRGMVGIGGFYYSSDECALQQIDAHGPTNFRPRREFTDEELKEARERADAIGSIAPWAEHVCIDKDFRRYRMIEVLS